MTSFWRALRTASPALLAGALLVSTAAAAQVFVYPRRPNKSQVRYYEFKWQHVDLMVGPEADKSKLPDPGKGAPPAVPGEEPQHVPPPNAPPSVPPIAPPEQTPAPDTGGGGGLGQAEAPDAGTPSATTGEVGALAGGAAAQSLDGGTPFPPRRLEPLGDPQKLLGARTGGVRLFFYERERKVAERAAALIIDAYQYLVGQFDYVPTQTFPYVLYSSYQEFLQTNLFPLQEGVLGVTSPVDLKLTLPYFGDDELFADVSAHEMAHQFTIQKVRSATEAAGLWGDPLGSMPLWFVEGLAEFYAKRGIDPEADMLVRDIVVNPDFELGYVLLDFYEDRPWSTLWTYKMGQVRCAFIEETYGTGTIQRILNESPRLAGEVKGMPAYPDFKTMLSKITRDDPKKISTKFEAWLKRRAFNAFLAASQGTPAVEEVEGFEESFVDALRASPSGNVLAVRSMDPVTGQSRLQLLDYRAPRNDTLVAVDGVPGVESLHPVWGRNFDLTDDAVVYVAESRGSDVLYWEQLTHSAEKNVEAQQPETTKAPFGATTQTLPSVDAPKDEWSAKLNLHDRRAYEMKKKGLIAAYSPAFSPDGKRVAFIGFDPAGNRDVYVLDPDDSDPDRFRLTRLTNDAFSERELAWGKDGIVFNSDATSHGRYNLFRVRPEAPGQLERLTTEARDHLNPAVLQDGKVVFTAYDRGRADVYEVRGDRIMRRTDIATGLFDLSPGPDGSVWALYHRSGRRWPVRIPPDKLLTLETLPQPTGASRPPLAERSLSGSEPYNAYAPRNWELGPPFGYVGAAAGGIVGQLVASASDKLRNHALLLNVSVLGAFELTDGFLVYVDQEKRVTWGGGLFQSLMYRQDQTFDRFSFPSLERFYGALGSARYPLNQFVYLQGDLSVGGVSYFLFPSDERLLTDPALNPERRNLLPQWLKDHEGPRFQTEGTVRFGYDTVRYAGGTGPVSGSSLMLEGSTAWQPLNQEVFGTLRLDGERYFRLIGTSNFFLRAGAGTTFGGRLARQFYLSSFDTLRGIPFGRTDWLIGRHFLFSTAELQIPLNSIIRVLILNNIEAIAGVDFGGVGQELGDVWDRRVLSPVLGVNFGLGPLVIRLHFARPLDIGAPAGLPARSGEWVTNFSIRILGFEGLMDRANGGRAAAPPPRQTLMGTDRSIF